ncbi:MAG TPA: aminoacyl-histidine dipeptidase [Myxococcota bacterium]|nr:aminoacyl-histidine dipeptidase [Myxococcota bacterium]HQK50450.1 aminoacyl-histidine dipeptidase [Myxococcota bacterium]
MSGIADLRPTFLFRHFEALLAIPRGSGNEAAARQHVLSWAREHGWDTRTDAVGNVVVAVPATPGHEDAPTVVLQGHLDIVCEKHSSVTHDFLKDPIPAWVDGDVIRTRGTTLGADNGIGVAAAMAVAEDPEAVHGPLELLFTIDEETGMTGAFGLQADLLRGRVMLNLDSEDEGTLFVGCAGGGDSILHLPVTRSPAPLGTVCLEVSVSGLKGGHSGLDIGQNRGNALKILARALAFAAPGGDLGIAGMNGGSKRNAIPREARAVVHIPGTQARSFQERIQEFARIMAEELGAADPGLVIQVAATPDDRAPITRSGDLIRLLLALPHGPLAMSSEIPGLVQTSTNLAIVTLEDHECQVVCNSRSFIGTAMEAVRQGIRAAVELAGGTADLVGQYPGWRPNVNSQVLQVCREVWREVSGRDALVTAIHAGLECGVIGERVPGMDMISFGPDIRGAHSPDEHVSISSTGRFYDYLKAVLRRLA